MRRRQQRGGGAAFLVLVILVLLFSAFAAFAQGSEAKLRDWGTGGWSTADTARQTLYGVVRYADMAQSRTIAKNPDKWKEVGAFASAMYGPHPTVAEVHKFNLLMFLGMWLVAYNIDPAMRSGWQWANITVEAYVVNENRKLGIKADWPLLGMKFAW